MLHFTYFKLKNWANINWRLWQYKKMDENWATIYWRKQNMNLCYYWRKQNMKFCYLLKKAKYTTLLDCRRKQNMKLCYLLKKAKYEALLSTGESKMWSSTTYWRKQNMKLYQLMKAKYEALLPTEENKIWSYWWKQTMKFCYQLKKAK